VVGYDSNNIKNYRILLDGSRKTIKSTNVIFDESKYRWQKETEKSNTKKRVNTDSDEAAQEQDAAQAQGPENSGPSADTTGERDDSGGGADAEHGPEEGPAPEPRRSARESKKPDRYTPTAFAAFGSSSDEPQLHMKKPWHHRRQICGLLP
jgi:hypothetical protein